MAQDLSVPDPAIVLDLIEAFRRSKAMFAAVSLGVFDALAAGRKSLSELAAELGAHADALERLLDACVGLQLLHREGAGYANTPIASTYLTRCAKARTAGGNHTAGTVRSSRIYSAMRNQNESS
jgi:acetylserotonin N-methyltransferase